MYTSLLRLSRKWHRWTAWGIGIFALMWFVTGILMVYPYAEIERAVAPAPLQLDSTIIAPNAALSALAARGVAGPIRSVQLRQIGERTIYLVAARGGSHAVDARTGTPFELAESTAVRLVTGAVREGATVKEVQLLRASNGEFDGPFPAYRLALRGSVKASAYVSNIGDVRIKNEDNRLKGLAGRLHTFVFPKVPLSVATRRNLIILASVFAVFLACTGFFLLLPVRRRSTT
jgi:hypothetical protein